MSRVFLTLSTAGFVLSAVLHLLSFTTAAPVSDDWPVLVLFAAAFVPLAGMIVRLRAAGMPMREWRRFRVYDWRALAARLPGGVRWLFAGMGMYVIMNLLLSLVLVGGTSASASGGKFYLAEGSGVPREVSREEYEAVRRVTVRLLTGHLLLFYLVPLVYFRFIEGAPNPGTSRQEATRARRRL